MVNYNYHSNIRSMSLSTLSFGTMHLANIVFRPENLMSMWFATQKDRQGPILVFFRFFGDCFW